MKLSYNQATAMGCSALWDDLVLCEAIGFERIELRFDMMDRFEKERPLTEVSDFFKRSSLKPSYCNAIYLYDGFEKPSGDQQERDFMKLLTNASRQATLVGSPGIVVVPPFMVDGSPYPRREDTAERVASMLIRMAEVTGNLKLALEPVGATKCALPCIAECKKAISLSKLTNAGLAVDICNLFMYREGDGVFQQLRSLKAGDIFIVHICDYDKSPYSSVTNKNRCFCGLGNLPVKEYVATLRQIGYEGAVSLETFRPEYYDMPNSNIIQRAYDTTHPFLS